MKRPTMGSQRTLALHHIENTLKIDLFHPHLAPRGVVWTKPKIKQKQTAVYKRVEGFISFVFCSPPPSNNSSSGKPRNKLITESSAWRTSNGRDFIQSWRWDPPKLLRKFPSFSQNDFEHFLSGGYPNSSSGIHCWGLDLSTGYPNTNSSWFSGYTQLIWVFLPGNKKFWLFSWGACHEFKLGSQNQLRIKTLPSNQDIKNIETNTLTQPT